MGSPIARPLFRFGLPGKARSGVIIQCMPQGHSSVISIKEAQRLAVRASSGILTHSGPAVLGCNGLPDLEVVSVADDLEVNVVVLGDHPDPIVVVTCDLLYVGDALRQAVLEALWSEVSEEQLFFAASHTHRAPMVDPTKPGLGRPSTSVLKSISTGIAIAIRKALAQPATSCRIEIAQGRHSAGINRRRRRFLLISRRGICWRPMLMAPNELGPNDGGIRRLRFVDSVSEKVVAEIWSTALHPTGNPRRDAISADFPGVVRRAIRDAVGRGIPVLFLQGFGGDIVPTYPSRRVSLRRFLQGPSFTSFTENEYRDWTVSLSREVLSVTWHSLPGTCISSIRLPIQREALVRGGEAPRNGAVHGLRIGNLAIVGVPSEVVVEYSSSLTPIFPIEDVWGVGCIDHVWGYAPTSEMLRQGGYEVKGFCSPFGVEGVNPDVESNLRRMLESMIRSLAEAGCLK